MNPISNIQSFPTNGYAVNNEMKLSLSKEENAEIMVPKPLECLNGTQIPPFLSKTYDLVDDLCCDSIVSWGSEGASFVVWDVFEFSRSVLPRNFKHNNFSSFVRQLNTYVELNTNFGLERIYFMPVPLQTSTGLESVHLLQGFRKIHTDRWEFANEGFVQGKRHLLKSIQRRRSVQAQPLGSSIELGRDELQIELEELKKEKSLIMTEVAELQQQQDGTAAQMTLVNEKLYATEQRQNKMVSFLANLFRNREFLSRLGQTKEQKSITVEKKVKKFLKLQKEPDFKTITRTSEFSQSPVEEISEFPFQNKVEYVDPSPCFVPCHIEGIIDKGKKVASMQVEANPEYSISLPEGSDKENLDTEVSSMEIGTVVKQEDLWNLDFEDGVGLPSSSTNLLGSFNYYDDVEDFGFKGSFSDVWDLDSWKADEFPSYDLSGSQNYDGQKTIP